MTVTYHSDHFCKILSKNYKDIFYRSVKSDSITYTKTYTALFEILLAYDVVVSTPWMKTGGSLKAINAPLFSVHSANMTGLCATRMSNSQSFAT